MPPTPHHIHHAPYHAPHHIPLHTMHHPPHHYTMHHTILHITPHYNSHILCTTPFHTMQTLTTNHAMHTPYCAKYFPFYNPHAFTITDDIMKFAYKPYSLQKMVFRNIK